VVPVTDVVQVVVPELRTSGRAPLGATLTRIAVQRLEPVGGLHGWRPAMPLTQFLAVKPYD
jgi:precorrin-6B methylase 2